MQNFFKLLRRQLDANRSKNLLNANAQRLLDVDALFLAAVEELSEGPCESIPDSIIKKVASNAAALFIERIYSINQYVQIDPKGRRALEQIYMDSWQELCQNRSRPAEDLLRNFHFRRIRNFVESLYPESLRAGLSSSIEVGNVVCNEYSAEIQLGLLRVDIGSIREPVLDIGCGSHAKLVTALRAAGVRTYGLDRRIMIEQPYLIQKSWFEFEFGSDRWGSIVSNLALSNHFEYVSRWKERDIAKYVSLFRRILKSLVPGGTFTFAPASVTLKERAEAAGCSTEEWPLPGGYYATRVTRRNLAPSAPYSIFPNE